MDVGWVALGRGEARLIDVYEGGQPMTRAEADRRVRALADRPLREEDLAPVTKRAVVVRPSLEGGVQGDLRLLGLEGRVLPRACQ